MPLPEAIGGDDWRVVHGPPFVDLPSRLMSVPTGSSARDETLRAHEMAHVRLTPRRSMLELAVGAGCTVDAINICEDLRVQHFLHERDIYASCVVSEDSCIEAVMSHAQDFRKLAGLCLASTYTPDNAVFIKNIKDLVPNADLLLKMCRSVWNFYDNLRDKIVKETSQDPVLTVAGYEQLTVPVARLFDFLFPPDGNPRRPRDPDGGLPWALRSAEDFVEWGKLKPIVTAQFSLRRSTRTVTSRMWSEEGVVPSAPYRLLLDSRVFSRKRRVKGGTILIDASGSMAFTAENLSAVIAAAPGATVAAYAGMSDYGKLAIVAKNGQMAGPNDVIRALSSPYGTGQLCGNVVDGPALEWLAKQPAPRIWVSDGVVTGVDDTRGLNLVVEAESICRRGKIERIEDWKEVVDALKE